jgi:hypothetical protein
MYFAILKQVANVLRCHQLVSSIRGIVTFERELSHVSQSHPRGLKLDSYSR